MPGTAFIHAAHVVAAGVWLGGLFFTVAVVSPAFKRLEWTPAERTAVRSAVGRQYAKVARPNLLVLFIAALLDWLPSGLDVLAVAEVATIALVCLLSELHAHFFAPRLAQAARNQKPIERLKLLRVSVGVSMLNLMLSVILVVLSSLRTA